MITGEQVYLPGFDSGQTSLAVDGSEFHHLIRVRRFGLGTEIWVVNGRGHAALCVIAKIGDAQVDLDVIREEHGRGELPRKVTLAIANLKGDHLDMVVEKATELGVHRVVPLLTAHTIKKGLKQSRLERIAVSAMKQSRRSHLPEIGELTPFKDFIKATIESAHLFCHASENSISLIENQTLKMGLGELVIWIGPEGDWSKDEIDLASISDYTFTGLGPRRLRAETAAIHAVGLVSALLQDPA